MTISDTKNNKIKRGITIIEVTVVATITILLGLALMYVTSGWVQSSMLDLTRETDEYIQSFRSLLVIENINYTEKGATIFVRNVSKWNISLTILEIQLLRGRNLVGTTSPATIIVKDKSANLPAPICENCKYGETLTYKIKYIPTALAEMRHPILIAERNFTNPFSILYGHCELQDEWILIDMINPVTTLSGEFSQTYPIIWIRAPLSSAPGKQSLSIGVYGQGISTSGSAAIDFPSLRQQFLYIPHEEVKPPYNITLETSEANVVPVKWVFDGLVEDEEVKIHVSGIFLLWRPEDKVVVAIILELAVKEQGDYYISIKLSDCNNIPLFIKGFSYTGAGWSSEYIKVSGEFKITDVYQVETSISRI